jgi:GxxExxY protein
MEKILECIKTVNEELGNHYKENIYQYALCVELNLKGYLIQTEVIVPIIYKGVYVGFERADIIIYNSDGTIEYILELKSQNSKLSSKEIMQLRKYLKNMGCKNGLLINFYEKLEIIKVIKDSDSEKININA